MSKYREVKYHEVFEKPSSKWSEEMKELVTDFKHDKPKRMMWECPHTDMCTVKNCAHHGPHEFEEDDCGSDDQRCHFGITASPCVRVGGHKHKIETEGRCDNIWEE